VCAPWLVRQLHLQLPRLTFRSQAVLDGLLLTGGSLGTAETLAPLLGLNNRFQLARLLRKNGLPPLHELAVWTRSLAWLQQSELTGCSLCHLAFRSKRDPSACYREIKRVTGRHWSELRDLGTSRVLVLFLRHCNAFGSNVNSH